ncbi:hypothetical protein A6A12_2420 [Vibrio anguillarum]|nr:hypothetical protein A6A12_2420 [Vibrio anguillarum]
MKPLILGLFTLFHSHHHQIVISEETKSRRVGSLKRQD